MADGKFLGGAFVLLAVTLGITFILLNGVYSPSNISNNSGWLAIISGVNTFFCQAYTIKTNQAANSYVVTHPAEITKAYDTVVSQNFTFPTSKDSEKYFFLVEGSHIKISTCCKQRKKGQLLLYRGKKCFWQKHKYSDFCPEIRKDVSRCGYKPTILNYDVPVTGKYYIVITDKYAKADVELKRTSFKTTGAKHKCIMSRSCRLETSGSVDIVVLFSDERKNTSYTEICEKRAGAWGGVAAIIVGVIALIVFLVSMSN